MSDVWSEVVGLVALVMVLIFAMVAPRRLPEAVVAVPAAIIVVALGVVTMTQAVNQIQLLGPTVGFLAAILVLARLADTHGVFRWLGSTLATASHGSARRMLTMVFAAASATTAVLSLDATVVLLTPVVLTTARLARQHVRPHAYACAHLSNSASLVLPVSNLTNLLAFSATKMSFVGFAAVMVLPWLVAILVEYVVFRWFFRRELTESDPAPSVVDGNPAHEPLPIFALTVLALTLAGFGVSGLVGVEPVWVALVGVLVLSVSVLRRGTIAPKALLGAASPMFCLFVFALGIVVIGVSSHGLGHAVAALMPTTTSLPNLLLVAAVSAVLANVVNNLPATLLVLAALGGGAPSGLILAMLLGVNIGPNLTYVGSLATLLWRRVLLAQSVTPRLREFTALGAVTVPLGLVGAVLALAASLAMIPH